MTTAQWPDDTALLLAIVLIAEQMLSRMPSGSSATWFVTLCGGSAAMTKTVESSGANPLDMVRRPRALGLVLGGGIAVFAGMPQGRLVEIAGPGAADIEQHEADRATDR